jgi:lipid-A-disaccharide synthase
MVVAYRLGALTAFALRHLGLMKAPYFAQPNLLAGRMVVPELAQGEVTPERLGRELERWLDEPEAARQLENLFTAIHRQLRLGASGKAAAAILDLARREAP